MINYLYKIYLPKNYNKEEKIQWPLIIFLHGAGERGNNLEKVKKEGLPKYLSGVDDFPFVVAYPQCPAYAYWEIPKLNHFHNEILTKVKIDESRIYLTGISMGGYGSWHWTSENPDKFAAIIPICGGGDTSKAIKLINVPTWAFHGAKDDIVPLEETLEMVEAIKKAGGNPHLTVYPDLYHDSWTRTYKNKVVYDWLLQFEKDK
ncbi:hypothetical protein BH23BAC1_BH23BAC1_17640 [soil metagenome]